MGFFPRERTNIHACHSVSLSSWNHLQNASKNSICLVEDVYELVLIPLKFCKKYSVTVLSGWIDK